MGGISTTHRELTYYAPYLEFPLTKGLTKKSVI
jgi:hypothetical protein